MFLYKIVNIRKCLCETCKQGVCLSWTSASLRSADKHTPYKMNEANRKTKYSTKKLPRDKKTNALASEVGFRAEPLAKTPTFSLTPYSYSLYIFKLSERGVFFFAQANPFLVGVISNKTRCCVFRRVLVLI